MVLIAEHGASARNWIGDQQRHEHRKELLEKQNCEMLKRAGPVECHFVTPLCGIPQGRETELENSTGADS